MGVIQGSLNQLVGTSLGAVAVGKHLSEEEKKTKIAEEEQAAAKVKEEKMDIEKAYDTLSSTGKEILSAKKEGKAWEEKRAKTLRLADEAKTEMKALKEEGNLMGMFGKSRDLKAYREDLDEAAIALGALQAKKEAIKMRVERSQEVLRKAGLIGGNK